MRRLLALWPWFLALAVGGLLGAAGILVSLEVNHYTSTEKFCGTSCHSMTAHAEDPRYLQSAHINNSEGVRVSCGQCHVPTTNWFLETWVHVSSGIHDLIVESTFDFSDTKAWEARRVALAQGVREKMHGWKNQTCTKCHVPASIKPASQAGQMVHAALAPGDMACAACHRNLVHARPAEVSCSRRSGNDQAGNRKHRTFPRSCEFPRAERHVLYVVPHERPVGRGDGCCPEMHGLSRWRGGCGAEFQRPAGPQSACLCSRGYCVHRLPQCA